MMSTSNQLESEAYGAAVIQQETVSSIKQRLAVLEQESRHVGLKFVAHLIGCAEVSCGDVEAAWKEFASTEGTQDAVKGARDKKRRKAS